MSLDKYLGNLKYKETLVHVINGIKDSINEVVDVSQEIEPQKKDKKDKKDKIQKKNISFDSQIKSNQSFLVNQIDLNEIFNRYLGLKGSYTMKGSVKNQPFFENLSDRIALTAFYLALFYSFENVEHLDNIYKIWKCNIDLLPGKTQTLCTTDPICGTKNIKTELIQFLSPPYRESKQSLIRFLDLCVSVQNYTGIIGFPKIPPNLPIEEYSYGLIYLYIRKLLYSGKYVDTIYDTLLFFLKVYKENSKLLATLWLLQSLIAIYPITNRELLKSYRKVLRNLLFITQSIWNIRSRLIFSSVLGTRISEDIPEEIMKIHLLKHTLLSSFGNIPHLHSLEQCIDSSEIDYYFSVVMNTVNEVVKMTQKKISRTKEQKF
ncbi:hypothetical protein M0811_11245 [Anaeramoeba ignava]|uniref:Uncharacterized protein n=1 Tax=Anaeramoeba ignava TaxID=1746090 RepID=A0A9Q0LBH8_ANAIG|nr:hypothetical protein M0811_11245 [Anaeramoeba ignava]